MLTTFPQKLSMSSSYSICATKPLYSIVAISFTPCLACRPCVQAIAEGHSRPLCPPRAKGAAGETRPAFRREKSRLSAILRVLPFQRQAPATEIQYPSIESFRSQASGRWLLRSPGACVSVLLSWENDVTLWRHVKPSLLQKCSSSPSPRVRKIRMNQKYA